MKKLFVTAIVLSILFIACKPKYPMPVTFDLVRSDYTEVIRAGGSIQAVNSVSIMAPMVYYSMTVAWVIREGSQVEAGDTVCILESPDMMQMLDNQEQILENSRADLIKMEANHAMSLALLDAQVKENKASMAITRLDSIQMSFAPKVKRQIMELELQKSRVQEGKLKKKLLAQRTISESEIRQLKSRIGQAETQVRMIRDQLASLTIVAPAKGMIAKPDVPLYTLYTADGGSVPVAGFLKIGNSVRSRRALMSLPDLSEVQIVAEVPEVDYMRIDKGQKVNITVDAAGGLITTGVFKRKSLAAKSPMYSESNLKSYEVIISVDSCHLRMTPGLSARCEILVNQVKDTLVVPTLAIFERDSQKVVYVEREGRFRPVPVETGLANSSQTIISKGLEGHETLSLQEPPHNLIEKQ